MREVDVSQPNRASNIAKKSRNMITGSRCRHVDAANFRKVESATEKTYGALYGTRSEAPLNWQIYRIHALFLVLRHRKKTLAWPRQVGSLLVDFKITLSAFCRAPSFTYSTFENSTWGLRLIHKNWHDIYTYTLDWSDYDQISIVALICHSRGHWEWLYSC